MSANLTPSDTAGQESLPGSPRFDPRSLWNSVERFLLYLSKTDLHALRLCTSHTVMTQQAIGGMVLATGLFAFFSSLLALNATVLAGVPILVPALIAAVYASAIVLFDREIVSAYDRWAVLLRIPFAIILGVTLSFPFEMKLLEGAINEQIRADVDARLPGSYQRIREIESAYTTWQRSVEKQREEQVRPLRLQIQSLESTLKVQEDELDKERARVMYGPKSAEWDSKIGETRKAMEGLRKEIKEIASAPMEPDSKLRDDLEEQKRLLAGIEETKKKATDFLSRMRALENIIEGRNLPNGQEGSHSAFWLSWFLRLFFVSFELFPVLIKLFMQENEYHAYLDARRLLAMQKIGAYTNKRMLWIRDNPEEALRAGEDTDRLEDAFEDSVHRTDT